MKNPTMNIRQIETLRFLQQRDDINAGRRLGLEDMSIDTDGMAWANHCGVDLCANPGLLGWCAIRDMKRDREEGTSLQDAMNRAETYAREDMCMSGMDRLLRAIENA